MLHILQGQAPTTKHHHDTVREARDCQEWETFFSSPEGQAYLDAEARAEIAAEVANERWFEERGMGGVDQAWEDRRFGYYL